MAAEATVAVSALNRRYMLDHPAEAAARIESLEPAAAARVLQEQPLNVLLPVWEQLGPGTAEPLLAELPQKTLVALLTGLDPGRCAAMLSRLDEEPRGRYLALLAPQMAAELRTLMSYSPGTAGRIMETRVVAFRGSLTAREALRRLRGSRPRSVRKLLLVDADGRLTSAVDIQDLALAEPEQALETLARPVPATISPLDRREEVAERLRDFKLEELPVVDVNGRLLGIIDHAGLVQALQEEASADIQTMVGASRDERALSKAGFAVRKRLPWLQINLLTAFLAASVVALFESTIAQFTALAVLMPVVAGQSGNSGAQALAVTMRGLALREITVRHWFKVMTKEINVGFLNGVLIALTCGIFVWLWNGSFGLALVIALSMVISMMAAGVAGALVPITLTRLGQDPAQSSSIILTTVTDVAGFMSFLGIATLLAALLI